MQKVCFDLAFHEDRWVHVPSGRVYNLKFSPPKKEGLDDVTGEKLTKRADDTEVLKLLEKKWLHINPHPVSLFFFFLSFFLLLFQEAIRSRLEKFKKDTSPVLEFYRKKNLLFEFSGETSKEIYPKVTSALKKLLQ